MLVHGRSLSMRSPASAMQVCRALGTPSSSALASQKWDAVIVGGGHNGLVASAYLAKEGKKVLLLERRHILGGAAVTEELHPGFKYSRASYVLSLLRPTIKKDLELEKHGLKLLPRSPSSFTPMKDGRYLLLGPDGKLNHQEISKFSVKDAEAFDKYEGMLEKCAEFIDPMLDEVPLELHKKQPLKEQLSTLKTVGGIASRAWKMGRHLTGFWEVLTAPASYILDKWFESEVLKATIATDGVIGAMVSPSTPGSGYVLLHHVMGETNGARGVWAYVQGGMGALSDAIAKAAVSHGARLETNQTVQRIVVNNGKVQGVQLADGSVISAPIVLSNATPHITYTKLVDPSLLPAEFNSHIRLIDYTAPQTKINMAVDRLPNFKAIPNGPDNQPGPHHRGTIHLGAETMAELEQCFNDAKEGQCSSRPLIEMTIPSALDSTIAPPGKHVVQLFVQYTPYQLKDGSWKDPQQKEKFFNRCMDVIEEYAPGFRSSVLHKDILTPVDLEEVFNLTGGNIFHGSVSLHNLYFRRPAPGYADYRSPIEGLYLCGAGAHPGGGVMGAAGRNCASVVLKDAPSAA
eukprot:GILJ01009638.1.p1 GENE.GILJ01009638.1~~GILJ01009638.1.p1  ORF type:complete len:581 (+),score=102.40 GILJ01009638.1:22-1743(+)